MAGASSEQRLIVRRLFLTGISYLRSPPGAARPHRTCCKVSARLLANMDCAMRFCAALLLRVALRSDPQIQKCGVTPGRGRVDRKRTLASESAQVMRPTGLGPGP
jgi:hypothetical protein